MAIVDWINDFRTIVASVLARKALRIQEAERDRLVMFPESSLTYQIAAFSVALAGLYAALATAFAVDDDVVGG